MLKLDVRMLNRKKSLEPGVWSSWEWSRNGQPSGNISARAEEGAIVLHYTFQKEEKIADRIRLTWTPCRFGGRRVWFLCPGCHRRVAVLWGWKYFRCRHCHGLAYKSQSEGKLDRLLRRKFKLKDRLGGESWWRKPKGMHQTTFDRLRKEYQLYDEAADYALYLKAKRLFGDF